MKKKTLKKKQKRNQHKTRAQSVELTVRGGGGGSESQSSSSSSSANPAAGLEDAAADARVRRGGLDETLEAAPGDEPGDGRDGAEIRTAEVQRRVARAEPAGIAGRRVGVRIRG